MVTLAVIMLYRNISHPMASNVHDSNCKPLAAKKFLDAWSLKAALITKGLRLRPVDIYALTVAPEGSPDNKGIKTSHTSNVETLHIA